MQQLREQRRGWVADKVRLTNRLIDALQQYCPPVLDGFKDKDTRLFCDVLTRWPTLKHAPRARNTRLRAFFQEHTVRYAHVIAQRVPAILTATPSS